MFNAKKLRLAAMLIVATMEISPLIAAIDPMDIEQHETISTQEKAYLLKYLSVAQYFSDKLPPEMIKHIFDDLYALVQAITITFLKCETLTRNMPISASIPRDPLENFLALIRWLKKSCSLDLIIHLLSTVDFFLIAEAFSKASELGDLDNVLVFLAASKNNVAQDSWSTWDLLSSHKETNPNINFVALDFAIRAGHTEIVLAQLDAAGPNAPWLMKILHHPFAAASDGGHTEIFKFLHEIPRPEEYNALQRLPIEQEDFEPEDEQDTQENDNNIGLKLMKRIKKRVKTILKRVKPS